MTYKDWNLETDVNLWSSLAESLKKKAQQTAAPQGPSALAVAQKLANRLSQQMQGGTTVNVTATPPEGQADVGLNANNINNLDNLLDYMWKNKIAVDGQQVVYKTNEVTDQQVDQMQLATITGKTQREVDQRGQPTAPGQQGAAPTRRWMTQEYYFNQPLLVKYIQYLQKKAADLKAKAAGTPENATGQLMMVYVGKLISDLNTRASTNIPAAPRSTPNAPTTLPDDQVVDTFNEKIFDTKNPGRWDGGPVQLHAGNLKSLETLNAWLVGQGDQDKMGNSNKGAQVKHQDKLVDYRDDPCAVIQVLYIRARNSRSFQTTAEGTKRAAYYLTQISAIGPQFQDGNGNACSLTVTQQQQQQQDGYGQQGAGTGPTAEVLQQLVSALPLDLADIDFTRITTFLDLYQSLILPTVDSTRQANVANAIQESRSLMRKILPMTRGGRISNFPVDGLTPNTVMSWGADPPSTYARPILDSLDLLVRSVGTVIRDFWQAYARGTGRNQAIFNQTQRNEVEEQILGSSILQENISMLSAARLRLPQAGQTGQR